MSESLSTQAEVGGTVRLKHSYVASPDEVFDACTDPERIPDWFGPAGDEVQRAELDLRAGGHYRIELDDGDRVCSAVGEFLAVERPELLVFTCGWEPILNQSFAIGETVVRLQFRERGDWTEVMLTHEGLPTDEARQFHDFAWGASLDRLEALLLLR